MRGDKTRNKANKIQFSMTILAIIWVLILSCMPITIALSPSRSSIFFENPEKEVEGYMDLTEPLYFSPSGQENIQPIHENQNPTELTKGEQDPNELMPSPLPSTLIRMKNAKFDPLKEEPKFPSELLYATENGYFLVQCNGPIQLKWIEDIKSTGTSILGYIPDYAYIVYMKGEAKASIEKLPFIRWIGIYHPAYKIQSGLLAKEGEIELNVVVFKDKEENLPKVRNELRALSGIITYDGVDNNIVRTRIEASKITDISFIPEVEWIDEYSPPITMMNYIRVFTGANTIHVNGFNGSGIVGEIKEEGLDMSHPDFVGQIKGTEGLVDDDAHGTCVFGIIFSSGANNEDTKGMLPGAEGVFCNWQVSRISSLHNLRNNWEGVFQSNSWSMGLANSTYSSFSLENDQAVYDYDRVMLYSAGNNGLTPETCSQDSVAKNVIAVGALWHFNNTDRNTHFWADGGLGNTPAQGPASDGRVKPDLAGPFDVIYTTDSVDGDGEDGYAPGNYTTDFGGTSGATPVVAGAVGLVYQMYMEDHFGNNPLGTLPHASTVKAILIADAYQYDLTFQANRYQQGWGGVDIGKVYSVGENHFIVDETESLQTGESASYAISHTGSGPLKISLVWTDEPASAGADPALVNDLDLKVTDPDGIVYWGNYGLLTSKWSSSGGSADSINNVENVFIQSPKSGTWTIEVNGTNIPGGNQAFGLVASNAVEMLRVDITYPTSGSLLNDIVPIAGTASTDIISVEVKIDNGLWESATGASAWSYDWDSSLFPDGDHTIYARGSNGTTYSEIKSVDVTADNTPPITSLNIGNPKYFNGSTWCVVASTQFSLSADDGGGSGVNTTRYRIWYEENVVKSWANADLFTLSWGEGNYSIEYYSWDDLGNNEEINSTEIFVDSSPPKTDLDIGTPKSRDIPTDHWNVTIETVFTLILIKEMAGVNFYWYTIDGSFYIGTNFTLIAYPEGLHTITWGAEDYFGFNETGNLMAVFLDKKPPTLSIDIGESKWRDYPFNSWNVTPSTLITIESADQFSGVNFSWYKIDDDYYEGASFTLDGYDDGFHEITWGAVDNVGNNETKLFSVFLDSLPPITDLDIGEPKYHSSINDSWNVTKTTLFKLLPTDEYAQVNYTWYTINGIYFEGLEFDLADFTDGSYFITWGSIDFLGQNETGNSLTIHLDSNAPETAMIIGDPKYRKKVQDSWNVSSTTSFIVIPSDAYSGVNFTWYKIDNIYFQGTSFNLTGFAEGYHTITWGSVDNLTHQEDDNAITVNLNMNPPTTTLEIEGKKYRKSIADHWNVTGGTEFILLPENISSGISFTWYTIDDEYFLYEGEPFTLWSLSQGPHNITWGSKDNLGFNETKNAMTIILDTMAPETNINISDPRYREDMEDHWAVSESTSFTFNSSDNFSDVGFTWYNIDNAYFEGSSFDLSGYSDGQYVILWGSEDNLGNNETAHSMTIELDSTPPSITVDIGQPKVLIQDVTHINSSTSITLMFIDSGVNESTIYYTLDGGITYHIYESPFSVPAMTTAIIYSGEDILGNQADESIFHVVVDNTDTDEDGTDDLWDQDDDNDGLLDIEEDENQNGKVDKGETDPLNPDTDGDGHWDGVDEYPLDKSRWQKEDNLLGILLLIFIIVPVALILLFLFLYRKKIFGKGKVEWMSEEETEFIPHDEHVEFREEETEFLPHDEHVEFQEDETEFVPEDDHVEFQEDETEFALEEENVEFREEETEFVSEDDHVEFRRD